MEDSLWMAANVMDFLHIAVVVPLLFLSGFGKPFGLYWGRAFLTTTIGLQIACLGCPMTILSDWMRSFSDPSIDAFRYSFAHQVYQYFGAVGYLRFGLTALLFCFAIRNVRLALGKTSEHAYSR